MAENVKQLNLKFLGILVLVASSLLVVTEGRPYPNNSVVVDGGRLRTEEGSISMLKKGLYLYMSGIKTGGPSSKGEGHSFINSRNLRVTINSGPSSGAGH